MVSGRPEGRAVRDLLRTLPNQITAARLVLIPVLWVLAWLRMPKYVAAGILAALISDVLDGVLARRLDQVSEAGSKFDSVADNILLPSSVVWLYLLRPEVFVEHPWTMAAAVALYVSALFVGLAKFGRFANLHLYSSRIASVPLYAFMVHSLLAEHYDPILLYIALGLFIISSTERLLLLLTSSTVTEHMGSILLIRRARKNRDQRRGE